MTQQESIELLNRELKELTDLLAGMKECNTIPEIFLNMARDKALRMAEGFEKLARTKTVEPQAVKQPEPVKQPEQMKQEEPAKQPEPVKPEMPEIKPEQKRPEPMPVKEAFSAVFKEFTQSPVTSAPKSDLRSLMTLNDRFLFQRELFRGDIGMLNYTLDELNKLASMEDAMAFLEREYHWEEEATGVKEFVELLERHFKGTII
ncbi:MAG: hypothetical protein RR212_05220 [Bacteroidales bacterium]